MKFPNGEETTIKLQTLVQRNPRAPYGGFDCHYATRIEGGGFQASGYGESKYRPLAIQKAISEAVERISYLILKRTKFGTANSNGFAAHITPEAARTSALMEVLERDAVLVHWLTQTPLTVLSESTWPRWLRNISRKIASGRYPHLKIMTSHLGYIPTVTAMITDHNGSGVTSHAYGANLEEATMRALRETFRIANMALAYIEDDDLVIEQNTPTAHAMAYAFGEGLPKWIPGSHEDWSVEESNWALDSFQKLSNKIDASFTDIDVGCLQVAICRSSVVQNLFFSSTSEALYANQINFNRLRGIADPEAINSRIHFVA